MPQTFPNLDGLLRLSRTEGVDIRPALLRVLTDLYVQEPAHTREQERQYVELALRLLPVVDLQTRSAVMRKLRGYAALPAPLREYVGPPLAGLDKPVPNAAAQEASSRSGPPPAAAAAQKQQPIENDVSPPPAAPAEAFSTGELFLQAGSAERRHLIARLDDAGAGAAIPSSPIAPAVIERLERAALQRNPREFARELQTALGISSRLAWRIVQDEFGEPLLIAARFLGVPPEVVVRITLFLNPAVGESVERVFALARLYERIGPASATAITASWRDASRALEGARYQPLHAAETSGSAAARDLRSAGAWSGARSEPRTSPATDRGGRQATT